MWPSSSSFTPSQWSFNPVIYQNIPYEQIDWASLAQQWIKMNETVSKANPSPDPIPPPAPLLSKMNESASTTKISESIPENLTAAEEQSVNDIEGGEAPMDMDTKDDEAAIPPVGVNSGTNWNQWNNWQSQWGWGWSGNAGTVPLGEKTPSTTSTIDSKVKSLSNDSIPVLNNFKSNVGNLPTTGNSGETSTSQVAGSFNYNNISGEMIPPVLPKSTYWNDNSYSGLGKSSWSKGNKLIDRHANKIIAEQYPVFDSTKKKQLPAWIREGLNKMERAKQKQLEKERILHVNPKFDDLYQDQSSENHAPVEAVRNEIQSAVMEDVDKPLFSSQYPPRSSPSTEPSYHERIPSVFLDTKPLRKTKEQIMEESMLKVRRILTQFLLEATESYVRTIAKEELKRKRPALAQQLPKSNALASLTANLGLNVYDSDSQSSDSDMENDNDRNSDEELQTLIEKKKRDFTLIEDQIENEIGNQELREREMSLQDNEDNVEENEDDRNGNHIADRGNVSSYNGNNDLVRSRDGTDYTVSNIKASEYVENKIETYSNKSNSLNFTTKVDKVDRVNAEEVDKSRRSRDLKKRARSSSPSTSSSSSSSSSSSKSRNYSSESGSSSSSSYSKEILEGETRKREESKRYKYRSRSRSTSRSRYRRSSRRYKNSPSREDAERRKNRNHPKSSSSRHRRSPSYHGDSRESSLSKYKSLRRYDSGDSWRNRRRSNSRETRHSHYRKH